MATVSIEAVSHSYAQHPILKDVNLKIEKGEFVVIVGPSGCGKSTLLRLIAGLDTVQSGSILINDRCVNKAPPSSRDIAMVFQNYALYPHMTVFDNMAYGLRMRKMDKKVIQERVALAGKILHLTECMHRLPAALSGGQRQRVAMGRAMVRSPAVFLFDEPLSNLDFKLRVDMRHEIKKLHRELSATCIYVTHDQTEAMTMATRIVVFNEGRILQVGSPRMVYDYPNSMFVASFLGHYPMNFMTASIDNVTSKLQLATGLEYSMPTVMQTTNFSSTLVVGIRPEHLKLSPYANPDSFEVEIDRIDDMGADRLVNTVAMKSGEPVMVRMSGDEPVCEGRAFIQMDYSKASLFCTKSSMRVGGWNA
jgi:ABC-type sugar transport system ATPase subunit